MEKERDDNAFKEENQVKSRPVFLRWRWIVGLIVMALGGVLQFLALPFADLVLISTNSIAAIIFNTFLSIRYLGEKFIWKYDVPAFSFMGLGGVIIVMMAKTDDRKYTPE